MSVLLWSSWNSKQYLPDSSLILGAKDSCFKLAANGKAAAGLPERSPDATVFAAFIHLPRGNAGPQTPTVSATSRSLGSERNAAARRSLKVPPSQRDSVAQFSHLAETGSHSHTEHWGCLLGRSVWHRAALTPRGAKDREVRECPGSCGDRKIPDGEGWGAETSPSGPCHLPRGGARKETSLSPITRTLRSRENLS